MAEAGPLLVIMTVDVGNGESGDIRIHQFDEPQALAIDFLSKYGLNADAIMPTPDGTGIRLLDMLTAHISTYDACASVSSPSSSSVGVCTVECPAFVPPPLSLNGSGCPSCAAV
jgi:hypothetical protein